MKEKEVKEVKNQEENKKTEEVANSSTYRKVENKKHRTGITLKRFIFLVFAVVLVIILIIGIRWRILYNMQESYKETTLENNWHYYSDSEDTIMNVYRKGTIWKVNTRQKNGEGNLTFWRDTSTGEAYVFFENPIKKYKEDEGGFISDLQPSSLSTNDNSTRILMAATPIMWIGTGEYDGKDCYTIKAEGHEEYIDKETGLLLAVFQDNKQIRNIEYEFGKVTDEDVAKPDLSQYEYLK